MESGGAFFSAELLIKLRARRSTVVEVGVPHYPRTAGSADRREALGHPARGARLLATAAERLGEPPARFRRATRSWATDRRSAGRARPRPARRPPVLAARVRVERVHEVAEHVQARVHHATGASRAARRRCRSGRRSGPGCPRRDRPGPSGPTAAKMRAPVRTASARASRGRASTSMSRSPSRDQPGVVRLLAHLGPRPASTRAPRASRADANRSWVSGRSGVRPWSFIAIALASHWPIQIGR